MKKHQCALFDLDGVIVDTAKYHFLAWKKVASNFGYILTEEDNEQLKGVSRPDSLQIILKMSRKSIDSKDFEACLVQKNKDYLESIKNVIPGDVLPGITDALAFLNKKRIKIGLGSASKNAKVILDRLELTSYFEVIIDGNQVEKSKPDPEVFLKGSTALQIAPEYCVVFEDSASGILAAKAAGMTAIALGNPKVFSNYDFCYPDFLPLVDRDLAQLF
ncbi:MAG: beta-phosphoglucomutase [Flavobacteriaceae bacterium]